MSEEVPSSRMSEQPSEREAQHLQANRTELIERIARIIPEDGTVEPLKGVHLYRRSIPRRPVPGVVDPSLCVIAQGSKEVLIGDSRYRYDEAIIFWGPSNYRT